MSTLQSKGSAGNSMKYRGNLAERTGLEPATPGVTVGGSDHRNYLKKSRTYELEIALFSEPHQARNSLNLNEREKSNSARTALKIEENRTLLERIPDSPSGKQPDCRRSSEPNATLAHDLADPWRPLFHAFGDLNGEVVRLVRQYELLLARLKLWRFGIDP